MQVAARTLVEVGAQLFLRGGVEAAAVFVEEDGGGVSFVEGVALGAAAAAAAAVRGVRHARVGVRARDDVCLTHGEDGGLALCSRRVRCGSVFL